MTEFMTTERAQAIVYDAYSTGLPEATAVTLTGRSASWVAAQYRTLARRGISAVAGQQQLFDID